MAVNQVGCDSCGAVLKVPEKYWGKKIKCPSCQSPMAIPASPIPTAGPAQLGDDDFIDDDPDDDFLNMDADSFESGPPLPKKRKKKRTSRSSRSSDYSSGGSTYTSSGTGSGFGDSAGTIGTGILMMVGAVVWFVVGFFCGIIFFYPPILFILGLVQVFRGLFSSGD
ncbi:MAG: hypothetical protein KDA69_11805 [Planctomycetaceae bacterium]|nr:hypothetical protein [Planctomycetaceae bacterium]MCA9031390.1 hypothetical protein [Planctomycetaceae bacterium]MCA9045000.1 hypothetical protein [Planctomycetaceae bacterium]MCB9954002.1 hypothetical protein [Planctomycetaceae bacterium]